MTTLADLRTKARNFIKDTGDGATVPQKVTDTELGDYAAYACADYSRFFPRKQVQTNDPAASPIASLPSDLMTPTQEAVRLVENGSTYWTEFRIGEAVPFPSSGDYWYWRGDQIYLSSTPSTAVYLHYDALHGFLDDGVLVPVATILADEEEDPVGDTADAALTVPAADEELLVIYMAAKFHQKIGTVSAKLDRFRERGERDDNPLIMMHDVLILDYRNKIQDRMHKGTVRLRKI